MTQEQKLREAKKRVKRKKDFYGHLATYVAISVFLIVLNMITSPGKWWFQWPVIGWGMAVLFNYFDVFGVPGVGPMNKEWEQKPFRKNYVRWKVRKKNYPIAWSCRPYASEKTGTKVIWYKQLQKSI